MFKAGDDGAQRTPSCRRCCLVSPRAHLNACREQLHITTYPPPTTLPLPCCISTNQDVRLVLYPLDGIFRNLSLASLRTTSHARRTIGPRSSLVVGLLQASVSYPTSQSIPILVIRSFIQYPLHTACPLRGTPCYTHFSRVSMERRNLNTKAR
jgi:hypothetical protein